MSLPMHLTPIGDGGVLLEPGDGLDPGAPDLYLEEVIAMLQGHATRRLFYDLRQVAVIDHVYYRWLNALFRTCRVVGIELVAVNMRPATAFALTQIMTTSAPFRCALNVDMAR